MRFVDLAKITVKAGDGGRGCSAFAQPPYTRFPYPDGGDGGDGGDVIIRADPNIATLLDFQFRHEFAAGRGGLGGANTKTGKRGDDCLIRVPVGTVIREAADGRTLRDLTEAGDEVIVNGTLAKNGSKRANARNVTMASTGQRLGAASSEGEQQR